MNNHKKLIILGSGPAGYSASIYAGAGRTAVHRSSPIPSTIAGTGGAQSPGTEPATRSHPSSAHHCPAPGSLSV